MHAFQYTSYCLQAKLEEYNQILAAKRSERLAERREARKEERRHKAQVAREERKQLERDAAIKQGWSLQLIHSVPPHFSSSLVFAVQRFMALQLTCCLDPSWFLSEVLYEPRLSKH